MPLLTAHRRPNKVISHISSRENARKGISPSVACSALSLSILMLLTKFTTAEQVAQPIVLVNDPRSTANVLKVHTDWSLEISTGSESRTVTASNYVKWGSFVDQTDSPQLLLNDGTTLICEIVSIDDDSLTVASRSWGQLKIARNQVRAFWLQPTVDALKRDRKWKKLGEADVADQIYMHNGDVLAGKLVPTTERNGSGLFGLVSVSIQAAGRNDQTTIDLGEVDAVSFNGDPVHSTSANCLLGFRDGNMLAAESLRNTEQNQIEIVTTCGAKFQMESEKFIEQLTFIQHNNKRLTYLSDLPARSYKSLPFLDVEWPLGVNENVLGGRLRSNDTIAFKGIGMHSTSRVVFDLDGKYQEFQAELALDDQAGRLGSVIYRVLVESPDAADKREWKLDFTSPIIRGGDEPLPLSLDVTNATRIALLVEMADRGDVRDYANWLNARLVVNELDR